MRNFIIFCIIFSSCFPGISAQSAQQTTPSPSPANIDETITVNPANPTNIVPNTEEPKGGEKEILKTPVARYASKEAPARIAKFETAPTIDGNLNDAVWQTATVFGDFLQTNPGDNIAPSAPTEAMIGYDAKNLYIAFRVKQERDKIRATVARRDNIFSDDYIGVYLDTFNDQRQAYVIFFNPLGVQADGIFSEGRNEDFSVDIVMDSKGVLTEDGYTIEAAIPFKSLRYEAGKNKNWGIHIFRRIKYKNEELDSWMKNNRGISGSLNQAGHITGLEGIETTRQLEINPSFTVSQTGRRTQYTFDGNPAGRYINDGIRGEFGVTAKFSLTPTITLDFAYNPDFAQVEADAPVTTANIRFPIFFAERRPFFLERIDIFQTGMNVVNTRAIVDPDIAAKITGRRGKNTFGVLYASDNAPGNYSKDERQGLFQCRQRRLANPDLICANERFIDKNADIGVLRFKRDIGRQHNLGMFATTYNFVDRHNNTGGFDGRFRLSEKIVTDFQVVGTTTRGIFYDPNLNRNLYRTGNGFGYRAWGERAGRNLYMNYMVVGRTRDYRADVGFTNRTDTNYAGSFVRYQTERDAKKSIIYKRLNNSTNINYDWGGRIQNWNTNFQGMVALQRQTYVGLGVTAGYERIFEREFGAIRKANRQGAFFGPDSERSANNKSVYGFIETTPVKQIFVSFVSEYTLGQLDYDYGAGRDFPRVSRAALLLGQNAPLDPGAGNQFYIESSVRYQPTNAFQTQLDYNKTRLVRNDTGRLAFDDNLFSSRSTYQFTRNTFARLRLDYSTLSKRFRPQFVVGWTPSPGTALYAGYNDDFSYRGYNPYTGTLESGFRGNGRTFFIKASYLFRKSF